jgi:Flp pilus assembly protein TadD
LERLDGQFNTLATSACRLEGQAWLTLAEADASKAAGFFEQALVRWQELGHPYDTARAMNGLGQAFTLSGDKSNARSASEQAMGLVKSLATQLEDPALKTSFLESNLVQEIRAMVVEQLNP